MAADVHNALKHVAMQELGALGLGLGLGLGLTLLGLALTLTRTRTRTRTLTLARTCVPGLSAEAAEAKLAALAKAGRIQREIWH